MAMAGALIIALTAWLVFATLYGALLGTILHRIGKVAAGRETKSFGRGGGSEVATDRRVTNAYKTIQTSQIKSTSNPRISSGQEAL